MFQSTVQSAGTSGLTAYAVEPRELAPLERPQAALLRRASGRQARRFSARDGRWRSVTDASLRKLWGVPPLGVELRVQRLGFFARLFKIIIPTALPLIFAGLRISLGVGWMVLVAAEILSTSEGIGKFVNDMYTNGSAESFAQIFVVVFIVGFIGMVLDRIMVFLQRLVSFDTTPAL